MGSPDGPSAQFGFGEYQVGMWQSQFQLRFRGSVREVAQLAEDECASARLLVHFRIHVLLLLIIIIARVFNILDEAEVVGVLATQPPQERRRPLGAPQPASGAGRCH